MAFRTNADAVIKIIDTIPDRDLDVFILPANELVTELCANYTHTPERLTLIETWLAAHFYTIYEPRVTGETAGSIQSQNPAKIGFGLKLSHYGQMAMRLDTSGALAAYDNRQNKVEVPLPAETSQVNVGIYWLGEEL